MAQYRGYLKGNRGATTRLGTKGSGLYVEAASWEGKVTVQLYRRTGMDYALVRLEPHMGAGSYVILYDGPASGKFDREALFR